MLTHLVLGLYRCLLAFYPAGFRQEFGPEMTAVFARALSANRGPGFVGCCWRELRDWPGLVLRIHLTKRRNMMITNVERPRWFFYPAWVALSTISIPITVGISLALISLVVKVVGDTIQVGGHIGPTEDYIGGYIGLLVLGLITGFLQYLLLRHYLPRMGWWIVATTPGLLLGLVGSRLLLRAFYSYPDSIWLGILGTMLLGGSLGLVQWVVLRQHVHHAAWWILANVIGWGVIGLGVETLSTQMIIPIVGIWLVPATATSVALWLLLDRLPRGKVSWNARHPITS